ncbi:hypothetical protein [Devosia sp. DBB001]|nr:hypothetical protein [Devosia sp. DBB001]
MCNTQTGEHPALQRFTFCETSVGSKGAENASGGVNKCPAQKSEFQGNRQFVAGWALSSALVFPIRPGAQTKSRPQGLLSSIRR